MKRKILSVIALILCISQLLPVYAGAVDTFDVYPVIYMYQCLTDSDQDVDSHYNLQLYQTTSEATSFEYVHGGNTVVSDDNSVLRRGVMFPINNITNIEGGYETYIVNFTMQIRAAENDIFDIASADTLDLRGLYINYCESDERFITLSKDTKDVFYYESPNLSAYYKWTRSEYFDDPDLSDDPEAHLDIYNLHFILFLNLNYNSN